MLKYFQGAMIFSDALTDCSSLRMLKRYHERLGSHPAAAYKEARSLPPNPINPHEFLRYS